MQTVPYKKHMEKLCDTYSGNFTEIRFKMNMVDIR